MRYQLTMPCSLVGKMTILVLKDNNPTATPCRRGERSRVIESEEVCCPSRRGRRVVPDALTRRAPRAWARSRPRRPAAAAGLRARCACRPRAWTPTSAAARTACPLRCRPRSASYAATAASPSERSLSCQPERRTGVQSAAVPCFGSVQGGVLTRVRPQHRNMQTACPGPLEPAACA